MEQKMERFYMRKEFNAHSSDARVLFALVTQRLLDKYRLPAIAKHEKTNKFRHLKVQFGACDHAVDHALPFTPPEKSPDRI